MRRGKARGSKKELWELGVEDLMVFRGEWGTGTAVTIGEGRHGENYRLAGVIRLWDGREMIL